MKLRLSRHAKLQLDFRLGIPQVDPTQPLPRAEIVALRDDAMKALEAAWPDRQPDPPRWYRKRPGRKRDGNVVYLVARIRNVECVAPVAVDRRLVITIVPRNVAREARNLAQTGRHWVAEGTA